MFNTSSLALLNRRFELLFNSSAFCIFDQFFFFCLFFFVYFFFFVEFNLTLLRFWIVFGWFWLVLNCLVQRTDTRQCLNTIAKQNKTFCRTSKLAKTKHRKRDTIKKINYLFFSLFIFFILFPSFFLSFVSCLYRFIAEEVIFDDCQTCPNVRIVHLPITWGISVICFYFQNAAFETFTLNEVWANLWNLQKSLWTRSCW